MMNFEVGKFYKTANGLKAKIYSIEEQIDYPIHGAVFRNGQWRIGSWTITGLFQLGQEHREDLVSEWVAEPREWILVLRRDGVRLVYPRDSQFEGQNSLILEKTLVREVLE